VKETVAPSPPTQSNGSAPRQPGKAVPVRLPKVPPGRSPEVGPSLAAALEDRWESYRGQLRWCQRSFSEKAVHELRVATRRLLAQFVLLSCAAPSAGLEKARRILKRRTAVLGDLRDTQVQLRLVDQQVARFPELEPLRGWLRRRERRLVKPAARKVSRFRTKKLGKAIAAMTKDLAANAGNPRARKQLATTVVRAAANAFAEAVRRRQAIDLADLRTIHQTRVVFKRFRYMVESLSPGITGLSKRHLRALAYYQRKMGIIQDLEVMLRCVASFVREHKRSEPSLRPFCRYLRQRRARALRSFLKSADRLFEFWPPARLAAPGRSTRTRKAA
jgi:CHAD domain-containing protein